MWVVGGRQAIAWKSARCGQVVFGQVPNRSLLCRLVGTRYVVGVVWATHDKPRDVMGRSWVNTKHVANMSWANKS